MVINTIKKEIEYVCAGHPPALLIDNEGTILKLDKGTVPIGLFSFESLPPIEKGVVTYKENSQLYLYTDGLLDLFGGLEAFISLTKKEVNIFECIDDVIKTKDFIDDDVTFIRAKL